MRKLGPALATGPPPPSLHLLLHRSAGRGRPREVGAGLADSPTGGPTGHRGRALSVAAPELIESPGRVHGYTYYSYICTRDMEEKEREIEKRKKERTSSRPVHQTSDRLVFPSVAWTFSSPPLHSTVPYLLRIMAFVRQKSQSGWFWFFFPIRPSQEHLLRKT